MLNPDCESMMNSPSQMQTADALNPLARPMGRLVDLSVKRFRNHYAEFVWPEVLPETQYWMGPELLSTDGTAIGEALSEAQKIRLSKWESINLYSLSMYGERDLTQVVFQHIHSRGYEDVSEYFHHFVDEENKHMWFFSQFCERYGGKTYPQKALKFADYADPTVKSYLSFAKIMIFEEIGDYYNVRIKGDERLPPFIRHLNRMHHQDESRHLAMARELLRVLHARVSQVSDGAGMTAIENYLKRYIRSSLQSFYNADAYRDAGLAEPFKLRNELMNDPSREPTHLAIMSRAIRFFTSAGLFESEKF